MQRDEVEALCERLRKGCTPACCDKFACCCSEMEEAATMLKALADENAELTRVAQRDATELMHTRRKVENQRTALEAAEARAIAAEEALKKIDAIPCPPGNVLAQLAAIREIARAALAQKEGG